MALKETKRLRPKQLITNDAAFAALQTVNGYTPVNGAYKILNGAALAAAMKARRDEEAQAVAALKTARDKAVASEWDMHNFVLGAKDQVAAQYGKSSNEYQSLGLKKKTEYKKPVKKAPKKSA